ncbi:MAG: hypothetical protein NTZ09_14035 [Candidatus Hydrogenedentes bacterium]|nr:hypothetical protein [Candidatus Hydrogenedentota bacterium]
MRMVCYAVAALLAALVAAAGARAQDEPMTVSRLFQTAGARSAAASSGVVSARVTEYGCLKTGNAAAEAYDRALSALISALETVPADVPLDPALIAPDKADWAVETWYETDYAYDKGRYRLSKVTPSGSYYSAFDGVAQFRAEQRTLYIDPMERLREPLEDIDINLMRWDQIPAESYVRDDQEFELKPLGGPRYNVWLRNKNTGDTVDQVFNIETGMLERGSMRNAAGQLLQEHLWLRPVLNGVWAPSVFVKMERAGGSIHLSVHSYKKWEIRPILDEEIAIPRNAYDTVAGMAFPVWQAADEAPVAAAGKSSGGKPQLRGRRPRPLEEPGIDMIELTKPPTQSYVMRTVGLSLIVIAVGLMVLYLVKWRTRWNEVLRTSFGLRKK